MVLLLGLFVEVLRLLLRAGLAGKQLEAPSSEVILFAFLWLLGFEGLGGDLLLPMAAVEAEAVVVRGSELLPGAPLWVQSAEMPLAEMLTVELQTRETTMALQSRETS